MAITLLMTCGECGDIEVSSKNVKLIEILDGYHPENGTFNSWVATCPCPGCIGTENPIQLGERVDRQTSTRLRQHGVSVTTYNPNAKGNIPKGKSIIARFLDTPKRAHLAMENARTEFQLLYQLDEMVLRKFYDEIDRLAIEVNSSNIPDNSSADNVPRSNKQLVNNPKRLFDINPTAGERSLGLDYRINPN